MDEIKFEDAVARLEDIVKKMEEGELTLEESLKVFEEGITLARVCSKQLDEADRTVELLLKEGEGVDIKPFAGLDENER
jgi:exodeoxyribonuclease VII small subunit